MIAKLFLGPQDGLQMTVQTKKPPKELSIIRPVDAMGDPQDQYIDVYAHVVNGCIDRRCPYLHYAYVITERTTDV